ETVRVILAGGQLRVSHAGREVAVHQRCSGRFERLIDPLRTVFRDTFSARTTSLIDRPLTRCSRLIRPIVSTTNIPRHPLASPSGPACTSLRKRGSKLDADYPSTGVNLPRRNTALFCLRPRSGAHRLLNGKRF